MGCPQILQGRGSSPLARGTLILVTVNVEALGLIPARAGNTACWVGSFAGFGAHPRSRGEHPRDSVAVRGERGSSPLARGTREGNLNRMSVQGLIPARAGNTMRSLLALGLFRAHPRSRGEHFVLSARLLWRMGSSPLARGTPFSKTNVILVVGLIPARAGNTVSWLLVTVIWWAHPRSRGEHEFEGFAACKGRGSSPLARGTHQSRRRQLTGTGLIPARAGNTTA